MFQLLPPPPCTNPPIAARPTPQTGADYNVNKSGKKISTSAHVGATGEELEEARSRSKPLLSSWRLIWNKPNPQCSKKRNTSFRFFLSKIWHFPGLNPVNPIYLRSSRA